MNVKIINPLEDGRWDDFVVNHEFGTLFHLSVWCRILQNTFGYKPCYLVLENQRREIVAGLPVMFVNSWLTGKRFVSLPRTSFCDPLVRSPDEMQLLVDELKSFVKIHPSAYFELKSQKNFNAIEPMGLKRHDYFVNQILHLEESQESLWAKMGRTSVRQCITKAEKGNVKVRLATGSGDLRLLHNLHRKTTEDHSVPFRPLVFFEEMWRHLSPDNRILIAIAEVENAAAAAGLFFHYKKTLYFEFVGIDYAYSEKSPAHLLLWETMKMARDWGVEYVDFGLTPINNKGLIAYKRRWGCQEHPLHYYYFPDIKGYKAKAIDAPSGEAAGQGIAAVTINKVKNYAAGRLYKHFG